MRLRNAYVIEADECIKDALGHVVEVKARIIEGTVGNNPADGVKPKGVIHWVDGERHVSVEVRQYDRLFNDPAPDSGDKQFLDFVNANSLTVLTGCLAEEGLTDAKVEQAYQFEREGYFCLDNKADSSSLVFNQTIGLRDTYNT